MSIKKKAPQQGGCNTLSNARLNDKSKYNQNPLTKQDIERIKRYQRGKLIIALNEARQPLNMRQLSSITGIERPTMCRRLNELQEVGLATISHYAPCPISKYPRVGFYVKGGGNA